MMYGVGNDETTGDEIDQHDERANQQTDVGVTHTQSGHVWLAMISQAYPMIHCPRPNEPQFGEHCYFLRLLPLSERVARMLVPHHLRAYAA